MHLPARPARKLFRLVAGGAIAFERSVLAGERAGVEKSGRRSFLREINRGAPADDRQQTDPESRAPQRATGMTRIDLVLVSLRDLFLRSARLVHGRRLTTANLSTAGGESMRRRVHQ